MQQQQQPPGHRRLPSRARGNRVHSELYPIPVVDEELGDILVGIGDAEASWDHIRKAIGEYCTQCIDHATGRRVGILTLSVDPSALGRNGASISMVSPSSTRTISKLSSVF